MDIDDELVTKSLHSNSPTISIVADVSIAGSEAHMLRNPSEIFVSTNLDLYVADFDNNRVRIFRSGEISGTTVAGAPHT